MAFVEAVALRARRVQFVPLGSDHEAALRAAARPDGALWNLRITSVPDPSKPADTSETHWPCARQGNRFAFAVLDAAGEVLGSTSFRRHRACGRACGDSLHLRMPRRVPAKPCQHHLQVAANDPRI